MPKIMLSRRVKAYPRMWAACGKVKSVTSGLPLSRSQPHESEAKFPVIVQLHPRLFPFTRSTPFW